MTALVLVFKSSTNSFFSVQKSLKRAVPGLSQSLNSSFFPPYIGAEPGRAKEESRITCMRMLRTPPFVSPKSGEKPYLEVFSRFGLWRDFLIIMYKQQFLHSDWLKTCRLIPNQWNFTRATLNHIQFVFYHNIKDNERISGKICWQLKTTTRTWKCTRCIMQMSYLYAPDHRSPKLNIRVCMVNCGWTIRVCMEIRRWHSSHSSRSMYGLFTK